ncbi:hypothetical protein L207DRAFT_570679 [Hyaloscypha variabilis F]|uniref:Uncharacterized protein n=1 Tax=Hyaloscypha variabilis (strain UAMH 11265 / GT02V1 / F) TaxID=1149755 RepID=A0A2J6R677_HYAVF|nr:hypothetical protein L207DRAFT_570679 [Hyaloscypha variabilis F]
MSSASRDTNGAFTRRPTQAELQSESDYKHACRWFEEEEARKSAAFTKEMSDLLTKQKTTLPAEIERLTTEDQELFNELLAPESFIHEIACMELALKTREIAELAADAKAIAELYVKKARELQDAADKLDNAKAVVDYAIEVLINEPLTDKKGIKGDDNLEEVTARLEQDTDFISLRQMLEQARNTIETRVNQPSS